MHKKLFPRELRHMRQSLRVSPGKLDWAQRQRQLLRYVYAVLLYSTYQTNTTKTLAWLTIPSSF